MEVIRNGGTAMPTRRQVMAAMTGVVASALCAHDIAGQMAPTPQPMASPNAPKNENVPAGLDGAEIPVRNGKPPIPPATWMEIQSDAQKLLEMVTEFKTQVDHTNLSSTLPLPLIQQAQAIEKLAKHIQSRMKG
jgi:hypothetical protein